MLNSILFHLLEQSGDTNALESTIFNDAIFDLRLHIGYRQRKHFLLDCLLFFDLYTMHNSLERFGEKHFEMLKEYFGNLKLHQIEDDDAKRDRKRELTEQIEELKNHLEECQNVEHQDTMVGQAKVRACAVDLYCRRLNLGSEIESNVKLMNRRRQQIHGNSPYYNAKECDLLISF